MLLFWNPISNQDIANSSNICIIGLNHLCLLETICSTEWPLFWILTVHCMEQLTGPINISGLTDVQIRYRQTSPQLCGLYLHIVWSTTTPQWHCYCKHPVPQTVYWIYNDRQKLQDQFHIWLTCLICCGYISFFCLMSIYLLEGSLNLSSICSCICCISTCFMVMVCSWSS